ncbi:MAG TPA: RsmD family RNA methyltransferase [Candidatus Binataceae bacterium]|nr:RsmD family RNA methyltransferase [Candidatus Binataceae bacterium]
MAEIEITAMTFGPYGLGHADSRAVLVANAAPGDRLEVETVAKRRDYSLAKILRVVAPGPARRTPPCPFLPRCGGCDWQQIAYSEQVRQKGEIIAAEFRRGLGLELDPRGLVEPSDHEFGYRARIRLRVSRDGAVGFQELGSNRLVAIDRCLVAAPQIRIAKDFAAGFGRELEEIELAAAGERQVLIVYLNRTPSKSHLARAGKLLESDSSLAGVVLRGGDRRVAVGEVEVEVPIEPELRIKVPADLFTQVNHAQNVKLVAAVMQVAAPARGHALLDLFCGAGNFALAAARRGASVTGVDADGDAIACAARNAERLQLAPLARFTAIGAQQLAAFLVRASYRPDCVILDPPRAGAFALMEPIVKLRAPRVLYVSCDIATLTRDLRELIAHRYKISLVRGFDFFPNTHHTEIVAEAVLT